MTPGNIAKPHYNSSTVSAKGRPKGDPVSHGFSHAAKRCPKCETTKPISDFASRTRNGVPSTQTYYRDCTREYFEAWRSKPESREKLYRGIRASQARYPERVAARKAVYNAVRSGALVRGVCLFAGSECSGAVQAHHPDYDRPLEVLWACRFHHAELDRKREMERAA